MKRLTSSDSLAAMASVSPSPEDKAAGSSRGCKSILGGLEDEDCIEEFSQTSEKKRRLSTEQVKALEKNFEHENKLDPERKVKLAQELGLQPRQVAVWFQNRRARWKTKQLEKEYGHLNASYEALKLNYDSLHQEKEALLAEITGLKVKLQREQKADSISTIKEEMVLSESQNKAPDQSPVSGSSKGSEIKTNHDPDNYNRGGSMSTDLKERSSNSDCSVILNEENSQNGAISSENLPQKQQELAVMSPFTPFFRYYDHSMSSFNCLPFENPKISTNTQKAYHQLVKMEEQNSFFDVEEEPCGFLPAEEASILAWYSPEQWI